jgi:hydroxyacylglutathione hydrolase
VIAGFGERPAGLLQRRQPRTRTAFAARHVAGTFSFPLDGSFATYLGWLIPWGTPLTLLAETSEDVASAQRELVRIDIDRLASSATGTPADWVDGQPLRSLATTDFAELAAVRHHRPVGCAGRPP